MTYNEHQIVKPEVLAGFAAEALKDKAVVSNMVTKRSDHKTFFSSEGDTITLKVKGTLPVRNYALRNNRSQPIISDEYSQTKVKLTISMDRPYSAVRITDEQKMWDLEDGMAEILDAQTDTIVEKLEHGTLQHILDAPYERRILVDTDRAAVKALRDDLDQDPYYNMIVEGKQALMKMRTPNDTFYALVGLDLAELMVKSNRLRKDEGTGDSALASASLGTLAGVQLVATTHIPADQAIMFAKSGFQLFTGVSPVPQSVPFGTTISAGGFALRLLQDYDTSYVMDRQVIDTLAGNAYTLDRLAVFNGESQHVQGETEYFLRGLKMGIKGGSLGSVGKTPGDGSTDTPGGSPDSWLAKVWNQETIDTTKPEGKPFPLGGNYPVAKQQATASAEVAAGAVTAVNVTNYGSGYTSSPAVSFAGAGTGAEAVALLADGQVSSVVVTNGGTGFTTAPDVVIAPPVAPAQ